MAVASMVLGIIGLLTACVAIGIPLGLTGMILGIVALTRINRRPDLYGGKGFALTGIITGGIGGVLAVPLVLAILLPALGKSRELANRSYCAANLRGITQAMVIYSVENMDQYPLLPYAPYSASNRGTSSTMGKGTEKETMDFLYSPSGPQNGSPLAAQFMVLLRNQVSPKQYVCKSDPHAKSIAKVQDASGTYYTNFQSDDQISFSFAYPYSDSSGGAWWKNTTDSSLPIVADMAPLNGTGRPARNVTPGSAPSNARVWNSNNHQGDGQNVGFADAHTEFVRRPDIGQASDNIYSYAGPKEVADVGGTQPVTGPISIKATSPMFDIYMVPARDLNSGGL
jgi:hypothetical protein